MKDNVTKITAGSMGILSEEQYVFIQESSTVLWTTVSLVGIVSNVINIRTFVAMGLADGVTVSFLVLAVVDWAYLITSFCFGFTMGMHIIEIRYNLISNIDPLSMSIYFFNVSVLVNTATTLITTFLAVARCMCVALPLQFKNIFTRKRALVINLGFVFFAIVSYVPLLANMSLAAKFDPKINRTRLLLWNSPQRESVKVIVWMTVNMVLPFITQIIVVICVFVMSRCLFAAAKFRQASTNTPSIKGATTNMSAEFMKEEDPSNETKSINNNLSGKDLRVVQQVVLISLVFIICNIPKMIVSVVSASEPEFAIGKRYNKIYVCVNCMTKHFEIFNSAINLVIYYKYNTKFRVTLCRFSRKY